MGKKIYVSERQLGLIVEHVNKETINEGFKEVALSLALLAGVSLGSNKALAQKALKDKDVIERINNTLNNEEALSRVTSSLESIGYEDAYELITKNADSIKREISKPLKKTYMRGASDDNLGELLDKGYAIANINSDTIRKVVSLDDSLTLSDMVEVVTMNLPNDNLFVTGGYELKPGITNEITKFVDSVKSSGAIVTGVKIEASTDKEPIRSLASDSDSTGNVKLVELRINSVTDVLKSAGVNDSKITECAIPNNPNSSKFSRTMSGPERALARAKSKSSRYVNVTIEVLKPVEGLTDNHDGTVTIEDIVNKYKIVKTKGIKFNIRIPPIFNKLKNSKKNNSDYLSCPEF